MDLEAKSVFSRRYDIDWLRNFGILLLFPFHTARIFDYWEPNYVQNSDLSWTLSWFIAVSSYWFMPLLFWLAGSASWYALEYRSPNLYLKERFFRLFIPLVFGIFIIVPPQGYFAKLSSQIYNKNYFDYLKEYFVDFSDLSGYYGSFTPAHLWFIIYLFVFSLVALPLFITFKKYREETVYSRIINVLSNPWIFTILFVPLTLLEGLPSPGGKNPFYFLFLFIMGYIVCTNERFQTIIEKYSFSALVFLIVYIPFWFILAFNHQGAARWSITSILLAFMKNIAVWITIMLILSYGRKFLNFNHRWLPYINEAVFPVYILHQTVMIAIGYWVVKTNFGITFKFLIINVLTFVSCLILYEYVLKRIPILKLFFGIKR